MEDLLTPKVVPVQGAAAFPSTDNLHVVCVGAGYVGGPTVRLMLACLSAGGVLRAPSPTPPPSLPARLQMVVLAQHNPRVTFTVVDLDKERIAAWNSDRLPIFEPGLDEGVKAVRGKNLHFVSGPDLSKVLASADIIFVAVNTPTKLTGIGKGSASNITAVERVGRAIAAACDRDVVVVEKSTVPVKTAEALRTVLEANAKSGVNFSVLSNPEFLAEGTAMKDLKNPSRVLIGGAADERSQAAIQTVASLYWASGSWVPREKILLSSLWSSELSKLVANAFLAQRISSINSISALCEATGADVHEVAKAVGTDPRIGPSFLCASVGYGGSCFKKDILNLVYICRQLHLDAPADYWESVVRINSWQMERFSTLVIDRLFGNVQGKRIAVFGFAFKKDTGDVRESAAAYVCRDLLAERAELAVFDPQVTRSSMLAEMDYTLGVTEASVAGLGKLLLTAEDAYSACAGAHAILVLTEWPQFKVENLDWARIYAGCSKPASVFDGRGIIDTHALRAIGFDVYAIGRPLRAPAHA